MKENDFEYLIIGGTTKGGTTSLFNYLAEHPQICAASYKETRFFLDADYPLNSRYRLDLDGISKYNELFPKCTTPKLRLEATPDYLYSENCAQRITKNLSNVKMIFILRDPIQRLCSWYKYSQQDGRLSPDITIDEYVAMQLYQGTSSDLEVPQHLRSLEQGCYARYVSKFTQVFGEHNCLIISLDDLKKSPLSTMRRVCHFASLPDDVYADYEFSVANESLVMRFPRVHGFYKKVVYSIRAYTHSYPILHSYFRLMRRYFDMLYLSMNAKTSVKVQVPKYLDDFLKGFYAEDQAELQEFLIRQKSRNAQFGKVE